MTAGYRIPDGSGRLARYNITIDFEDEGLRRAGGDEFQLGAGHGEIT